MKYEDLDIVFTGDVTEDEIDKDAFETIRKEHDDQKDTVRAESTEG